jgi:heterotetrameric sarcosine oxidase gamma subunit
MSDTREPVRIRVLLSNAAKVALKARLPDQLLPCLVRTHFTDLRILCLGSDHWLLISETLTGPALCKRIDVRHEIFAVCDLSNALAILRITGSAARNVLAQHCAADLSTDTFRQGHCASTHCANIPIAVVCRAPNLFELYVPRRDWPHLHNVLTDAATAMDLAA